MMMVVFEHTSVSAVSPLSLIKYKVDGGGTTVHSEPHFHPGGQMNASFGSSNCKYVIHVTWYMPYRIDTDLDETGAG